jgi:addiction module HigA family antidote
MAKKAFARDGRKEPAGGVNFDNLDDYLGSGHVKPIHPGIIFNRWVIERRGLKITEVAQKLEISREMLHRILRGDSSITASTAIGLGKASNTDAEFWLRAQMIFDLWREREKRRAAERVRG